MTDNHDLHVEVQGDYIIITLPGTKFMVTYCKRDNPPELRAKSDWTDDFDASVTLGGVSSMGMEADQRCPLLPPIADIHRCRLDVR
jgi:hypothetical protein